MSKVHVCIWGREFDLGVSYQNYPGEEVTEEQKAALAAVPATDFEPSRGGVEAYIRKYYAYELGDGDLDNIFRYVMPKTLLIPRTDKECVFAVMCKFKLDMEHGIAVIFEDGEFKEAGPQDLIL